MTDLPSGSVTFLFTDIEGSTPLHRRLGDRYPPILREHDRLLRSTIERYAGVVVESTGDGIFAAFSSARDAVGAAIDAQEALAFHPWKHGAEVKVRMGLHTGDAFPYEQGYSSLAVNMASRVADAAHGGQVVATEHAVAMSGQKDRFIDLGPFRVKGFDDAVRLFQVTAATKNAVTFPVLRAVPAAAHNVPLVPTTFVGRDAELAELHERLDSDRLVSLLGPGGVGKTRLVFEAVAQRAIRYRDGAWVVQLAGLSDPLLVPAVVAGALGITQRTSRTPLSALMEHLAGREQLVVLDSCEHILGAVASLVHEILMGSRGVRVLTTSREPLRVPGEQIVRLMPLRLPTGDDDEVALMESDAMRLFMERASAAGRSFAWNERELALVASICERCEGIPLVIELAAARTRHLSLEQLDERLSHRLGLLKGGPRTSEPRHQTVRALIDWSHRLLSAEESLLYRRLSVFRGMFTVEAAEMVCADASLGTDQVLDRLSDLIDRSLVASVEMRGASRFQMLGMIRDHAAEILDAAGESEAIAMAHMNHFLELMRDVPMRPGLRFTKQHADLVGDFLDDLRAAFDYASLQSSPDAALELAARFARYSFFESRHAEGRAWGERALNLPGGLPEVRGWIKYSIGLLSAYQGDLGYAREHAIEVLEDLPSTGSWELEAAALHLLADVDKLEGSLDESAHGYLAALELTEKHGDLLRTAVLHRSTAETLALRGDLQAAEEEMRKVVERLERMGEPFEMIRTLRDLGEVLLLRHDPVGAKQSFTRLMPLTVETSTPVERVLTLLGMAEAERQEQNASEAARFYGAALAAAQRLGEQIGTLTVGPARLIYASLANKLEDELGRESYEAQLREGRRSHESLIDALIGGEKS